MKKQKVLAQVTTESTFVPDILRRKAEGALRYIRENPMLFIPTWKELFQHAPKGDFDWTHEEAGDWVFEEDDGNWSKYAYALDLSRNGGVEAVEITRVDQDGNWESLGLFERAEGENLRRADIELFAALLAEISTNYTILQQYLYSIHVAETGKDPLENTFSGRDPVQAHARNLDADVLATVADIYGEGAYAYQHDPDAKSRSLDFHINHAVEGVADALARLSEIPDKD